MTENIVNTPNEEMAYRLAKEMYEGLYNELMTAVSNSISNFDRAQAPMYGAEEKQPNSDVIYSNGYYRGKADAFREISSRIKKEHDLASQSLDNYLEFANIGGDNPDFERSAKRTWECFVERAIKKKKNEDVERIFPCKEFKSMRAEHRVNIIKGRLADLLEEYGWAGFRLGQDYERNYEKMKDSVEFKPEEFSRKCIETFLPEEYENL